MSDSTDAGAESAPASITEHALRIALDLLVVLESRLDNALAMLREYHQTFSFYQRQYERLQSQYDQLAQDNAALRDAVRELDERIATLEDALLEPEYTLTVAA